MKNTVLDRVDNHLKPLLKNALARQVFSAVAVGVYLYRNGTDARLKRVAGSTRADELGTAINEDTFFDLASLTKPLCTTLAILSLIGRNEIDWHTKIFALLPYKPHPDYKEITVEQLLTHSGGLIAYSPEYRKFAPLVGADTRDELIRAFLKEPLVYKPGSTCVYSDIGFMLLGLVLEKVTATALNVYFANEIAAPWHLGESLVFRKVAGTQDGSEKYIAATEFCAWRKRLLQGEVHDEHAWLLNGVAGHAGLFGSIGGVLALTEQLLHLWRGRGSHSNIQRSILQRALTRKYANQTWCRGFDTPSREGSSSGRYFSSHSVGHLGFTGTSFWIDPEQELVVVLLSNRVHPSRSNERIKEFRPLFHDTVLQALRETP